MSQAEEALEAIGTLCLEVFSNDVEDEETNTLPLPDHWQRRVRHFTETIAKEELEANVGMALDDRAFA